MKNMLFFIGTYSEKGPYFEANGPGIVSCELNPGSGEIKLLKTCHEGVNSTYLAKGPGNILLSASDQYFSPGNVESFSIENDGSLNKLSSESCLGTATCHLTFDSERKLVYAISYMSAQLSVHQLENDKLSASFSSFTYQGSGPNQERQESAHAHQSVISPDYKWLYVCDLGSDKIWVHDLSKIFDGVPGPFGIQTPTGYGPRHLVFHPELPVVYVICELSGMALTYRYESRPGLLELQSEIYSLPADFEGTPSGAAIKMHPSARTLYISNRQHNSISVYECDPANGDLSFHSRFSTRGKEPRDFSIDHGGHWLLAANQDSNDIRTFHINADTGLPSGKEGPVFDCGSPVCVLFN